MNSEHDDIDAFSIRETVMTLTPIEYAAKLIASADGILITAGAGMGVDSGLPDFRGDEGFWAAYPALARSGVDFMSIANPQAFEENPRQAWGFYGHRLALYRRTVPHRGFSLLKALSNRMTHGAFIITSNVDGQFQKAGFHEASILEIHGSIHRMQCSIPCNDQVWPADDVEPETDDVRCEWTGPELPICIHCGQLARPNILMFDDWNWNSTVKEEQLILLKKWLESVKSPVIIELGAGVDLPSIRQISEAQGFPLIRINPRHSIIPEGGGVSLGYGACRGMELICDQMKRQGWVGLGSGDLCFPG